MKILEDTAKRLGLTIEQVFSEGSQTMGPEAYMTFRSKGVIPAWVEGFCLDILRHPPKKAENLLKLCGGTDRVPQPIMGLSKEDIDNDAA